MKNLQIIFVLFVYITFTGTAQNTPPILNSVLNPPITNGYLPDTIYNLFINFSENSNKRSFRLKITNQANAGIIGVSVPVASNIDTFTESGMFYVASDTGTSAGGNFNWTSPSSPNETITFELVATAEEIGGTQTDVVYTCIYQVTNSSFGLTGNCTNSLQVGIADHDISAYNPEIYPNPVEENLTISYTLRKNEKTRIDILDLGGMLLATKKSRSTDREFIVIGFIRNEYSNQI